jgi:hypothetical protein
MSGKSPTLTQITLDTPDAFFFELVQGAARNQNVRVPSETEFYLVRLLNRFIFSESLYSRNQEGHLQDQPLALLFKEALEAELTFEQKSLFQNVGDISLYKAGFFQESLSRSSVDLDYYIGMGGTAYQNAASRCDDRSSRQLLSQLSAQFPKLVSILGEVSEQTTFTRSEQDLFRMYEMWSRTRSERAARALQRAGIKIPSTSEDDEH